MYDKLAAARLVLMWSKHKKNYMHILVLLYEGCSISNEKNMEANVCDTNHFYSFSI